MSFRVRIIAPADAPRKLPRRHKNQTSRACSKRRLRTLDSSGGPKPKFDESIRSSDSAEWTRTRADTAINSSQYRGIRSVRESGTISCSSVSSAASGQRFGGGNSLLATNPAAVFAVGRLLASLRLIHDLQGHGVRIPASLLPSGTPSTPCSPLQKARYLFLRKLEEPGARDGSTLIGYLKRLALLSQGQGARAPVRSCQMVSQFQ
jgi:hypothetical protein